MLQSQSHFIYIHMYTHITNASHSKLTCSESTPTVMTATKTVSKLTLNASLMWEFHIKIPAYINITRKAYCKIDGEF